MKVALVHDYLKEYGGAERVLESLHDIYPDATVFTSVYLPEFLGPHKERFSHWNIKTTFFQQIPFNYKLMSPFRLLAPFAFKMFNFSDFDVIIVSSTGAYFPNAINKKEALQICYCHTPPRYLYGYATAREWKKNKVIASFTQFINHFLRMFDFHVSRNVDYYIANSEEVAARIKKFYRRESIVVYPPVTKTNHQKGNVTEKKEYFLTGGRLTRAKHVDLIIKACNELAVPLKVFGRGFAGYEDELHRISGSTINFVGEISDGEKTKLMRQAKGFLFASEDEDFGIIPVEAMSCGTPVIAHYSGGVKETLIDGKTGIFFDKLNVESIISAVKKFEKTTIKSSDCKKQAEKFTEERFRDSIKAYVERSIKR